MRITPTVLVVDDDPGFRSVALRILRAAGFKIAGEAESCSTGMDAALALRPDAILVDARLPDGEGAVLARALLAMPWAPRVVLTSTDGDVAAQVDGDANLPFVAKADLPGAPLGQLLAGG